jgi:hypothetical protein
VDAAAEGEPLSARARLVATLVRMRAFLTALLVSLLAGCVGGGHDAAPAGPPALSLDLFPLGASSAEFVDVRSSEARTVRVEPDAASGSVRLVVAGGSGPPRELRVTRRDDSLFFSGGVEEGTELIRAGAHAGDAWKSADRSVTFDGWERVTLPTANYDAARITVRRGPAAMQQVETWWFAPGVGLVRLRSDHGTLFVDELLRSSL